METLLEFITFLVFFPHQAALLITQALFGDAVKPSPPLGLLKRLTSLKNSNK